MIKDSIRTKTPTDAQMLKIWKAAVKKLWGNACAFPGCINGNIKVLRVKPIWTDNPINGICTCPYHESIIEKLKLSLAKKKFKAVKAYYDGLIKTKNGYKNECLKIIGGDALEVTKIDDLSPEAIKDYSLESLMDSIKKEMDISQDSDILPFTVRIKIPESLLYFFKSRNIPQDEAMKNALLYYANLILWNEKKESPISSLEELQYKFYRKYKT